MSTSPISARRLVVVAVTAAVTAASTVLTGGAAVADGRSAADDYVAWLVERHNASQPYSEAEAYVRTLVFWHQHPDWTLGS